MKSKNVFTLGIMMLILPLSHLFANNEKTLHHHIAVQFDIAESQISVSDTLHFDHLNKELTFYLNKNLKPSCAQADIKMSHEAEGQAMYHTYQLRNKSKRIIITYQGIIKDGAETLLTPRHGQSSGTNGIVFDKGIYLSGSTFWVPRFKAYPLVTFTIDAALDSAWSVVSQGNIVNERYENGKRISRIEHSHPTNQIYLTANQWQRSAMPAGKVKLEAYLIDEDAAIARKYLGATAGFLKIYEERIGPYPYDKFALVENFWETGYGMPAFTLLGKRVIRMPWILYSSYPHELLHNYWGNGVYVDYSSGNWSEGITVYMADHYFKELKGEAAEYRRTALKNFTDYVKQDNDFPLSQFTSRSTKASSAIGYDKAMMFNHMLRVKLGDETFNKAYAEFYDKYKFSIAGFNDIQSCFEKVSGQEMASYFAQWVQRSGAPKLGIYDLKLKKGGKELCFALHQEQDSEAYQLYIPIAVEYQDSTVMHYISSANKTENYKINCQKGVKKITFDPNYDVMRLLDSSESPGSISSLMGASDLTIVVSKEDENYSRYQQFAQSYKGMQGAKHITIVDNIENLSSTEHILVLGHSPLKEKLNATVKESVEQCESQAATLIYSTKITGQNLTFLQSNKPESLMGILMKIQHYGSYSLLAFDNEGKAFKQVKFPVHNSSMVFEIEN